MRDTENGFASRPRLIMRGICSTDYYALQVRLKTDSAKITSFDNLDIIEKCKLNIDSLGCSVSEIVGFVVKIIMGETRVGRIVSHKIIKRT